MIYNKTNAEDLFIRGLVEFNNQNFYSSHEYWEELWLEHKVEHPLLIQGLIQFSVGCFQITNLNRKGAISLFNKSINKLDKFKSYKGLKIDILDIVSEIRILLLWLAENRELSSFKWDDFFKIKLYKMNESD